MNRRMFLGLGLLGLYPFQKESYITVSLKALRRAPNLPAVQGNGALHGDQSLAIETNPQAGEVFFEFEETWQKERGETGRKRLVSRRRTGRVFKVAGRVAPEAFHDDPSVRSHLYHVVFMPEDFTAVLLEKMLA